MFLVTVSADSLSVLYRQVPTYPDVALELKYCVFLHAAGGPGNLTADLGLALLLM